MALFALLGVLSPRRRLYPPAGKSYGLEAEPEAAGVRLRLEKRPGCGVQAYASIGHPSCSFWIRGWARVSFAVDTLDVIKGGSYRSKG